MATVHRHAKDKEAYKRAYDEALVRRGVLSVHDRRGVVPDERFGLPRNGDALIVRHDDVNGFSMGSTSMQHECINTT